jgi:hypothetical protein
LRAAPKGGALDEEWAAIVEQLLTSAEDGQ